MYLAIKWLVFLTLAMWVALCYIDFTRTRMKANSRADLKTAGRPERNYDKNSIIVTRTRPPRLKKHRKSGHGCYSFLNYLTFIAGAVVITAYNRRNEILVFSIGQFRTLRVRARKLTKQFSEKRAELDLNKSVARMWVVIKENISKSWQYAKHIYSAIKIAKPKNELLGQEEDNEKRILLNKLKELGEERKNLGQLLIAAIQENKNIRLQYKLESMAKSRLIRHLDEIHKQTKVCRSRYIALKQLHIETNEEIMYLKAREKKLSAEKEVAVKNLKSILEEINKLQDHNLKVVCSEIMRTVRLVSSGDLNDSYLQASQSVASIRIPSPGEYLDVVNSSVTEIDSVTYKGEEPIPKLRGLPGEYIWTVKDLNGMVEKLFEYDYGYTYDNGDTIQRIREYTVYHDKDCLLDFKNSSTIVQELSSSTSLMSTQKLSQQHLTPSQTHTAQVPSAVAIATTSKIESTIAVHARCDILSGDFPTTQRFLTGSVAFQTFLRNNSNNVTSNHSLQQRCINA